MLVEEVRHEMINTCGIRPGARLLVGVSGGPDSLSLLDALVRIGYTAVAAHFNHGLRQEAKQDARQVQHIAEQMGVAFVSDSADVGEIARVQALSVEEAARTMRYRFLFAEARRHNCSAVAVGHTADDQVETVLMHFLRGAGLAGLRGMLTCGVMTEWDSAIPLLRPLLGVWREEVMIYCKTYALDPVFDQSNLDTTYFRNRLRHELIPYLQGYNPQIKDIVWRMSQALAGDYEVVEVVVQAAWQDSRIEEGPDFVVLSLPVLRKMERGLKRSVVRVAINNLRPGLRDIDFQSIERAAKFIDTPTQSRSMDLVANLVLYASGERVFIGDRNSSLLLQEWPHLAAGETYELPVPGRLAFRDRWTLESRWLEGSEINEVAACTAGPFQACLDAACLSLPLQVRTRRPGDRFRPLGMGGHSLKLSDFWINEQLPHPARPGWPLLCSNDEIVWIPGFRPAESCRLRQDTHRAVHLILKRADDEI